MNAFRNILIADEDQISLAPAIEELSLRGWTVKHVHHADAAFAAV